MRFYFQEVDAELNIKEFALSILIGVGVIVVPLVLKVVLGWMV